jgi:hypothetical protein
LISTIIGNEYINKQGSRFVVLELVNPKKRRYKVKFLDTGFETETHHSGIQDRSVKDKYFKDMYGVACIGNASCSQNYKIYSIWNAMIQRCYNSNSTGYDNYGEKGVTVCERWLCFEFFLKDITKIDGYNEEKFLCGELHIDKDLKQQNIQKEQMVYSLNTCSFISKTKNVELANKQRQKEFEAVSPKGDIYLSINVSKFSRDHNLTSSSVGHVLNGKRNHHKGWEFRYLE